MCIRDRGYTTADAIAAIREVAATSLPKGYDIAFEGLSYDESIRGNESVYVFLIVFAFVYFVLAAEYESFIIPLSVIFSLPVGVFGSFMLLKVMGLENNIYAQIGLIMLIGILGKNAVLIVEFAVQKRQQGATILEAAIEGARVRFRPILMTSFAFVAGLIPLIVATGAGAIGNRTIGASALGGMLFGTVFGVITVSYTHLDVYKRQPLSRLLPARPWKKPTKCPSGCRKFVRKSMAWTVCLPWRVTRL